jgi:hypothetical protein
MNCELKTAISGFALQVERLYSQLIAFAGIDPASARESGPSLGGKLLFAGELNAESRALIVAASIAGAASLAVSRDPAAQGQAIREGTIDFSVNSLDEALRILKNEIRKRQPVAVCLALPATTTIADFERGLHERGVVPDLTGPPHAPGAGLSAPEGALLVWSVASAGPRWLPRLDALAAACLEPEETAARQWLQHAPRYLGRLANGVRLMRCREEPAARFLSELRLRTESGEIAVEAEVRHDVGGRITLHRFSPPK